MQRIFMECLLSTRDWKVTVMKRKAWGKKMSPFRVIIIVKRLKHTKRQTYMAWNPGHGFLNLNKGAYLPQSGGLSLQVP